MAAQEVQLGSGHSGKIRSFWVGLGLTIITFSIYSLFWYYFLNRELKDFGEAKGDPNLAQSRPGMSVLAFIPGGYLLIPPYVSVWNFLGRIQQAERLSGISAEQQIRQGFTFLLLMPGGLLIIPLFFYYKIVTDHQNRVLQSAAGAQTPVADPALAAS